MKIIYMGTPDFAVPALEQMARKHQVCCVVTQPDAVRDRGKKQKMTPVKEKALELGIPVLQPERIKKNHHGRVSERHKRDHFPAGGKRNFT